MNTKPTLYLIVGHTGAGKSMISKKMAKELPAFYLSHDELLVMAYGGLLEKLDFKRCCAQMDALIWKQAKRLYELNIDVVLEGYGTRAMRDRVKVEAAQIGFQYQVIWVECPAEERLSRVRLRNQSLTDEGFFISDTEFYEMEALNENLGEDEPATRIDNR